MPQSQPKKSSAMNSTAAFTRAKRLCSHVVMRNPTPAATSSDAPATMNAPTAVSNCMNPATPLAIANKTGPR